MVFTKLSKRERILFNITAGIMLTGLMYKFVFGPLRTKWSQLNHQIVSKERQLRQNKNYLQREKEAEQLSLKCIENVKRRGSDEEEIALLLDEVEKGARASQIHIYNIKPEHVKKIEVGTRYGVEISCEATMEQYIDFIYGLQKSTRLIRVDKLMLTSQGKDNPSLKARFSISEVLTAE